MPVQCWRLYNQPIIKGSQSQKKVWALKNWCNFFNRQHSPTWHSCYDINPWDNNLQLRNTVLFTIITLARCSMFAFLSTKRFTTSCRPWKQAKVRAVFLLVSIWALMSLPMSYSSLTAAVWPFIDANIKGDIPSLLPVRELISAPWLSRSLMIPT